MSLGKFLSVGLLGVASLALFIPTQGCSSDTAASGERICTPGANVFCRCADRTQGTKLCADDGKSFATACGTDDSHTECVGGEDLTDPDTGKPVDPDGNPIDPGPQDDGGTVVTNGLDQCPGKSTSLPDGQVVTIDGDTTGAKDDGKGTGACAAGAGGGDHIYHLIPVGSGRVDFTVKGEGAMNPTAYIRTKCDDETTQIRCAPPVAAGGTLTFQQNMKNGTDYFLVIDGASSSAGKYHVTAKLTGGPFCGDGKVSDGEACDDGNNTDNDGCSASCKQVNGDPSSGGSCPGHPVDIWSGQTVTGTGSNNAAGYANTFNTASNACSTGGNSITDHVYKVTPHATGVLAVSLTNTGTTLFNIVARKTCTDGSTTSSPTSYCKDKTQTLNLPVTANTPIYIAVDGGGNANNVGTYTITFAHSTL